MSDPLGLLRSSQGRLALSSGTEAASALGLPGYRKFSFAPREPWRQLNSHEERILLATRPPVNLGSHITLVRAPDDVMGHFSALREYAAMSPSIDELRTYLRQRSCQTGHEAMLEFARTYLRAGEPTLEGAAIVCKAAGLPTATTNETGAYVGLHVDNWYQAALSERAHVPNRISVNLGPEARCLLYINLPLAAIAALVMERLPDDTQARDTQHGLRRAFMSHFPSYPVVRVRLEPGEGYIAPTENMIHDASTQGRSTPDVQFIVRGRLWPG